MKEDTCVLCKTPMDKVMVCREEDVRYARAEHTAEHSLRDVCSRCWIDLET